MSLSKDVQPVFTSNCATSGCHTAGNTIPNLTAGSAYADIVKVTSGLCATASYVVPKQPAESFLLAEVTSGGSVGTCSGGLMVGHIGESSNLATIAAWIEQGALDN